MKAVALGYAGYMLVGWLALCLPISEPAAVGEAPAADVSALDHLFTAASAVSAAGLATVSTPAGDSFLGELAILAMIQFGGLGDLTAGSFFHSVSAFCTAGFSLFPDGLQGFRGRFRTNAAISASSLCGALGFLALGDVWGVLTGAQRRLTLTSRIILASSAAAPGANSC